MIAISRPNHPLRLAGVLGASVAFFAIVGMAVLAVLYIVHDERAPRVSEVAGVSADPKQSDLHLPEGLVAWHKVEDADQFKELIGFKPFVPSDLPATTQHDTSLAVSYPDDAGQRVGRVGFSARDIDTDGITGPTVVLNEVQLPPGAAPDGVLKRITTGTGRALAATIACGGLQVDLQFYYGPAPKAGESFVNPWMAGVAQTFVDSVKRQCGG